MEATYSRAMLANTESTSSPDVEIVVLSTPNYLCHLPVFIRSYELELAGQIGLTVVHTGGPPPVLEPSVQILNKAHQLGCGAARELARPNTNARWVLYTDSDVCFPTGFLGDLNNVIRKADESGLGAVQLNFKPSKATRWGYYEFLLDRRVILNRAVAPRQVQNELWSESNEHFIEDEFVELSCMQGFGMLIRREALVAVGGFDCRLDSGEDRDIAARLIKAGYRIGHTASCYVYHNYDFSLWRIVQRKKWHGKFSAMTSAQHPDLFPYSTKVCLRMIADSLSLPPKGFRSLSGRIYFVVQAMSFGFSHIFYSLHLSWRSLIGGGLAD